MKKILFGLTMAAALASCTDDYTDWAAPLQNAEEEAQTVTLTVGQAPAIDFATLTADRVQLFVPTVVANGTTTYHVGLWNADKTGYAETTTTDGYMAADELKAVVEQLYGKRPEARNIALDITAYTNLNGASVANKAASTVTVTLKAPFIDTAYYLTGDFAGWNKDGALAFTHIGDGDVYDTPEYQIVFTTTAAGQYWKIISGTNYDNDFWAEGEKGVVGTIVDGETSMEGSLTTTSPQAGKIESAGIYRMTINMMNYSYKLEKLEFAEYIYEIGNSTGWSTSQPLRTTTFDGKYQGYYYLDGEFKFKPNADNWDGDWGQNPDGAYGTLVQEGEWNCWLEGSAGFYRIDTDLAAMTWAVKKIEYVSIIGTANGNWDTDTDLTYNKDENCWEVTTTLNAGELKFRGNHNWDGDVDLGGSFDNLVHGGSNIAVEAGTYNIKLYISYAGNHYAKVTPL